jgi:5-methylcytosine-specific restriction endonuclease McrA
MKGCYKRDVFEKAVNESFSVAEVIRKLGLRVAGGNFRTVSKYIQFHNLDVSHFRGKTWNKGMKGTDYAARSKFEEVLKENTNFDARTLKERLITEGIKEYRCERCGNEGEWMGQTMTLELHHINGDHFDNRLENLQILCPNCHSLTDSYRRRKAIRRKEIPKVIRRNAYSCKCLYCGNEFGTDRGNRKFCCLDHYRKYSQNIVGDDSSIKRKIMDAVKDSSNISDMARKLQTSRTTIRKYLKEIGVYEIFKRNSTNILRSKEVTQYDLHMNKIKEWKSLTEAEKTLGISDIGKCANMQRKSVGGFIWRFKQ